MARGPRKRAESIAVPEIADGMCGRCQYWRKTDPIDETGECWVLAIHHEKGGLGKKILGPFSKIPNSPLVNAVHERTTGDEVWVETGRGEIVGSEVFNDVPKVYVDDFGERRKIWSHLRSFAWGGCSRYSARAVLQKEPEIIPETIPAKVKTQLSLFEDVG